MSNAGASEVKNETENRLLSRAGILVAILVLISAIAGMVFLASDARKEIDALAAANTDNLEWSLSQLEVEALKFQRALVDVKDRPNADLASVRRTFDIFYSRVSSVTARSFYNTLIEDPEINALNERLLGFRQFAAGLFDAEDQVLIDNFDTIDARLSDILRVVRALSLEGISVQAMQSEQKRRNTLMALDRLALLSGLFFLSLIAVAIGFGLVARIARVEAFRRADAIQRLETVIDTSLDAIMVIDPKGNVITVNPAAERIFGYTEEEAVGQALENLIVPENLREPYRTALERYRSGGSHLIIGKGRVRLEAIRKNGDRFPVELALAKTSSTERGEMVAYIRDISKEVEDEENLITARDTALQGEKAKARLLAVMSHEIRTPLSGLVGTIDLLSETELSEKQTSYVRLMKTSSNILMRHVNDVLDISKLDVEKYEVQSYPFEAQAIIGDVIETQLEAARASGNSLTGRVLDPPPPTLLGDPARITQVLLNLVGNANKFTHDGSVSVECEFHGEGGEIEFRVADTGVGIAPGALDDIFEDFVTLDDSYRRQAEGTGLGLGIARRLVRAMGGDIRVESEPGVGTVFSFTLPVLLAPRESQLDPSDRKDEPFWRPFSILLVEDNEINRIVLRDMLAGLGHDVTEAANGPDAIRMASQSQFDLILMDISMPGMDGLETASHIRDDSTKNRATPIIALTANVLPDDQARLAQSGIEQAILKPVTKAILRRELEAYARSRSVAPELQATEMEPLAELESMLGRDLLEEKLSAFNVEIEAFIRELENTGSDADPRILADRMHHHAGSAAVFGATELRFALLDLEMRLKGGVALSGAELAGDIRDHWTPVVLPSNSK